MHNPWSCHRNSMPKNDFTAPRSFTSNLDTKNLLHHINRVITLAHHKDIVNIDEDTHFFIFKLGNEEPILTSNMMKPQ